MKKFIGVFITTMMTLSCISTVFANDESVLLEDGVAVTMSSAEMEAASANLATGSKGTARSWDEANSLENIINTNTNKDSIDLNVRTGDADIVINEKQTYQEFEGMGSSIDESTVYNLSKMSEDKQKEFIKFLIDPVDGLGFTKFRLTIGSSDFQNADEEYYTYYDVKDDENYMNKPEALDWDNTSGTGFSIQKDRDLGIIKTIKLIQETAKELGVKNDIHFFATAWTLPGWMKVRNPNAQYRMLDNVSDELKATNCYGLVGGYFKYGVINGVDYGDEYVDYAATYFLRYLEEYAKEGITIDSISMGNETGNGGGWFVCNSISSEAQAAVAKEIKDQLSESNILNEQQKNTGILAMEWNIDSSVNGFTIEQMKQQYDLAEGALSGIALHDYGSQSTSQLIKDFEQLQKTIGTNVEIPLTERSVWGTYGMNRILSYFRGGCQSYNSWVTMLDSEGNSNQYEATMDLSFIGMGLVHLKADPTLLIQNASDPNEYKITPEAYMMAQFTKYIRPGYVRVESTDSIGDADYGISNVVFKNPNTGKLVMVVVNNSNEEQTFTAAGDNYQFTATIPATNVATYQWNPNDIDVTAPVISGQDATIYVGDNTDVKTLLNLSVVDDKDGEISDYKINLNGYDYQKAGEYTIEIIAQDKTGNSSNASYKITVLNKTEGTVENTDDGNEPDNTDKVAVSNQENTLSNKKSVKTGDSANLVGMFAILSVALLGIIICLKKKYNH